MHGPEGKKVVVEVGKEKEAAERVEARLKSGVPQPTQLTAYFSYNRRRKIDGEPPLGLTYAKAYRDLLYDRRKKEWRMYTAKQRAGRKFCRLKTVSPNNFELLVA